MMLNLLKNLYQTGLSSDGSRPITFQRGFFLLSSKKTPLEHRKRRHRSFRRKIGGNTDRPRLVVHRSNNHIYAQVIDDTKMHTLAAASTSSPAIRDRVTGNNLGAAEVVGKEIAKICIERGISKVIFDRAGYLYHGRVKALADSAREGGLIF
jgi:large subunit ribosomal protein L18